METLADYGLRLGLGLRRSVQERENQLKAARLPRLETVLAPARQRLDLAAARLPSSQRLYEPQRNALALQRLPSMDQILARAAERLSQREKALNAAMRFTKTRYQTRLTQKGESAARLSKASQQAIERQFKRQSDRLDRAGKLLDAYSYQGVLDRGYALVQDEKGKVVRSKDSVGAGQGVTLTFADGERAAVIAGGAVKAKKKLAKQDVPQGDLF